MRITFFDVGSFLLKKNNLKNVHPETDNQTLFKHMAEGSLEIKLPTIWTDEKQSRADAEKRERLEERRVEEKE